MLRIVIIFIIIIIIGSLQPFVIKNGLVERFLVPNNPHAYNWYQNSVNPTHVYSGTQSGDSHLFNKSGQYVKEVGSKDFVDCRNKGYTKEFCLQTPYTNSGPGTCMCDNGQLGRELPGYKGKCVCGSSTFGPNYIN